MAYRTRLPGPQAGTRARALRGPRLARLPPSRHALHRSLWLPGRRTSENSPLGMGHTEAHGDWPSPRGLAPRRLRSVRSGTCRTQSQPCAGGSPWPWPGVSSDVRAAPPASTSQIITPVHDAVRLGGGTETMAKMDEVIDGVAPSLANRAHRRIEDMIVTGALPPGAMISENGLREQLNVGRTPIREALQRLSLEGFVDIHPSRGVQ